MNILFRVSGGKANKKELGLGHVFRCINLANHFDNQKIYFLIEDYGGVKKIFLENGFGNIKTIKKNASIKDDIKYTLQFIQDEKIDVVIVDKFRTSIKYLNSIKSYVKVVYVSDLKNYQYPAHLIVNGFIGLKNKIIKNKFGTRCLLGPKFQILNKTYEKTSQISRQKKYFLLVTFGGYDEHNIIDLFCNATKEFLDKINIKIILGSATKKSVIVKNLEKKYSKNLEIISSTTNLKRELSNAKFIFSAGGITTYEIALMKIPFVIICQYRHQLLTAKQWENRKAAKNLGMPNQFTSIKIKKIIHKMINDKFQIKSNLNFIDGFGARRVAKEILSLVDNRIT